MSEEAGSRPRDSPGGGFEDPILKAGRISKKKYADKGLS